ncbi:MAG: folate family ECF transporter S component [Absicoccus porci]|uniref:folate family ECF transporter S component n=1 Tax=Absicoccus porci TaxID=2486576 RepID=UPI0023528BAE|nr:folate family ECF transporter S component [Absicoccus porci]MCI6087252.1 folate family ECF transporter S component [Absicoccus porci]MDD7329796.1 folate family ECF transporter S component [Absicoccus porci]MDY4738287.1 folate family ECF transporter S component [Absicoccus porci]MEE1354734.1 folate family ECF transporter S component [Absicoccus porci]
MSKLKNVRVLTTTSMMIAIAIILGFFKIPITDVIEIRFSQIPVAMESALFGPVLGGIVGALADIGGYIVKPTGPYFPGFTISGFVSGLIFALVLYKKEISFKRVLFAQILYTLIVGLGLNTLWLSMLYGNTFWAFLMMRFIKELIMIPINTALMMVVLKPVSITSFYKQSVSIQ